MGRLRGTTALEDLADCDIVIEAVVEDLEIKNEMWRTLDEVCGPETIFASNTSSLTIADMAAATKRPERMVGLHFFNPVPVMKLVEVVKTIATDAEVFDTAFEFAKLARQGADRLQGQLGLRRQPAARPLHDGRDPRAGAGRREHRGHRQGDAPRHRLPDGAVHALRLRRLDTLDKIGDIMFAEYKEKRYASPPLLKRMVSLGYFGRKTGKGFYDYGGPAP
jgi:3-hydroxybutyryl-CoA dehydrogenase